VTVELLIAIIAGAVALASAAITVYGQLRLARREHGWTDAARLQKLLASYGNPLATAAFDLQSRLWNIARQNYLAAYFLHGDAHHRDDAEKSTLWLIAQYFGWVEIMRRETQSLDLGDIKRNREFADLLSRIGSRFATDAIPGTHLRFFRAEQRALGELMIVDRAAVTLEGTADCMGYARFRKALEAAAFDPWGSRWSDGMNEFASSASSDARVPLIQGALVDLVLFLDPDGLRFPRTGLDKVVAE
jgi:hypothetical protein